MPVLYGVFLFMGVSAMNDIQVILQMYILKGQDCSIPLWDVDKCSDI